MKSISIAVGAVALLAVWQQGNEAPEVLTDESLRAMLVGLGYEPKAMDGGFVVTLKRDGWNDTMLLAFSADHSKLGINSNLGVVTDPATITAAQWRKLLEDNFRINPSFISLDSKEHRLFMMRALDNRGISAPYLRRQIDNFCTNLHGTAIDWQLNGI